MENDIYSNAQGSSQKPPRASLSSLISRNVTIAGHRTSVRLEPEMWAALSDICRRERASLHEVCTSVANQKADNTSLTAAIRVYVMSYYRAASTDEGHIKAGHGYGRLSSQQANRATDVQRSLAVSPYALSLGRTQQV